MQTENDVLRDEALAHLQRFCTRILPGTLRRIAVWKQIVAGELPALLEDLRQELALDCLAHPATVVQLPTMERHARWMRLAERWIYHHRLPRRETGAVDDDTPGQASICNEAAGAACMPEDWVLLGNGRWNLAASAARTGRKVSCLQRELERFAARLGYDAEYEDFWRARLTEALTGLAADLLRDRREVHLLVRARRRPDPEERLRRLRAIGARFPIRTSTIDVRRAVRPWIRHANLDGDAPRRLLHAAVAIEPTSEAAWAWLFEARLSRLDLRGACRAATTLARARLLEARRRWPAAVALLNRAARRWPFAASLRRALDSLGDLSD